MNDDHPATIAQTALRFDGLAAARRVACVPSPQAFRRSLCKPLSLALGVALLCGCETNAPQKPAPPSQPPANASSPSTSPSSPVQAPSQGTTAWGPVLPESSAPAAASSPPAAAPAASPAAAPQTPAATEKKAAVGAGKKGRGYGQGVIATPAATLWAVRERLVFEVQIPQAMSLFKATEGRPPKDHNEYMEKIIKANNIRLPELPEGDLYRYDPKTEQLMVDSPVRE
jgi:hypothetical protein